MKPVEVVTFGCRLNAYELELIRQAAEDAASGTTIVFNTCAVTGEAMRQARQAIRRARRAAPEATIVAAGCGVEIAPEAFAAMPEVDRVLGNRRKARIRILPFIVRRASPSARRPSPSPKHAAWSSISAFTRAPSSRSRTAVTTAAPSASSPTRAARRDPFPLKR